MSETVKFQTNVPETLSLAFSQGKEVSSQFGGDQVMFSLDDGRRMYVSPFVAAKIYEANIGAHTTFTLCKREVSHGNRRAIEWEIGTHNEAPAAPTTPTTHDAMVAALKASLTQTKAAGATVQAPPTAATKPAPANVSQAQISKADVSNGNAYADAPAWVAAPAATPSIYDAYKHAVDVAAFAADYAKEQGLLITPTFEDVRCIAATLFIQMQKGGAR